MAGNDAGCPERPRGVRPGQGVGAERPISAPEEGGHVAHAGGNPFISVRKNCSKGSDPFYIVTYCIKWVLTSWMHSTFILNSYSVSHEYALRNANDYLLPHTRYESLKVFPFYSFPKAWNELEPGFRSVTCKSLFKFDIKSHLMSKYSNFSCDTLFCYICSRS